MNYITRIMEKISIKSPSVFVVTFLFVFAMASVPSARACNMTQATNYDGLSAGASCTYSDRTIADATIWAASQGWTAAQIAAKLTEYGVTEARVETVAINLGYGTDAVASIQTAYAGVIELAPPPQLNTADVVAVLNDTATTNEEKAVALAAGGVSAADVVSIAGVTDPATIEKINALYVGKTVIQGASYYTYVSPDGKAKIYGGTNADGIPTTEAVGTFNAVSGDVTLPNGTTMNIASATGVNVCTHAVADGSGACTKMDGHTWVDYQAPMIVVGYKATQTIAVLNDPTATEEQKNASKAELVVAAQEANTALALLTGGTQTAITVVMNANGTLSYGCINSQNTTLSCPPGLSITSTGMCVAPTKTTTTSTTGSTPGATGSAPAPATGAAPATSFAVTSSGTCFEGFAYYDSNTNPPCVPCAHGINGNTGCGGNGGTAAAPLGSLYCLNGAINPTACDSFITTQSANAPVVTLTATPATINNGQSAKLTWVSSNANTCTATNGFGVSYGGTTPTNSTGIDVSPTMTSTYQITCQDTNGVPTFSNATVTVLNPSASISASTPLVSPASPSTTITWTLGDVSGCTITKKIGGETSTWKSGLSSTSSSPDTPTTQTTYTLSCPSLPSQSVTVNHTTLHNTF